MSQVVSALNRGRYKTASGLQAKKRLLPSYVRSFLKRRACDRETYVACKA